ncbi:MAG: Ig-like domain-containing protein [Sphingomonadales bacterium]
MQKVPLSAWFLVLSCCVWISQLGTGCANIVPPQGGPRDTIPPQLIKVLPADSSTRITPRTIQLYFDEYIDVQQGQDNLVISPLPSTAPVIESKLRDLTIKLKDSLLPNTTYSIDFGNTVKDFTEGNIAKGLRYVFSTGPYLDSLELYGTVQLAETGKIDSTLIVILHKDSTDSALIKSKPYYLSKLDKQGRFRFRNLPPDRFFIYALKDEGGARRLNKNSQLMAFADQPVFPQLQKDSLELLAFAAEKETMTMPEPAANKAGAKPDPDKRIRFQTTLNNNQQDIRQPLQLFFENPLQSWSDSSIRLFSDSTYTPVDSVRITADSTQRTIRIQTTWLEGNRYHLVVAKGAFSDSSGKTLLKTDTLDFTTKRKTDYGKVKLRLRGLDLQRKPVLQWTQNEKLILQAVLNKADFIDELFMPGDYQLRILYDTNGNGRWDTGQFFGTRRQPERVTAIDKKISIKPGWTNEYEIDVTDR